MLRQLVTIGVAIAAVFAVSITALAQTNPIYDIPRFTIGGVSGTSTGDGFAMAGSIGQAVAAGSQSGGSFSLAGGVPNGGPPTGIPR